MNYYFYNFVQSIDISSKKTIIKSTLKYLGISLTLNKLTFKSLDKYGYSYRYYPTIELYSLINDAPNLTKIITPVAFKEFIKKFKPHIKSTSYAEIKLYEICNDDEFYQWLEKYNLEQLILNIYYDIKKLYEITTDKYYANFGEYKYVITN